MLRTCCALLGLALFPLLARAAGPQPATAAGSGVTEVVVVFKTHFDIGFTDYAHAVVEKYRTSMIDQALEVCERNREQPPQRRFTWTVPGWPMTQILWSGQTPERRERITQAIRAGQLVWHALPYSTHTESLDLEDLTRGMRFSSDLSREFHLPLPRDAKMTDVPSHCWVLPTLLKHAGVEFLHLGCNPGSSSPRLPPLFWWEGADGSRVLTMYSGRDYGTQLTAPKDWPYHTWLALIHTSDNQGPPPAEEVANLLKEAEQKLPGVKIRLGRLSDFSDAILREKARIPVVRGDMPDTWIHGIMSMPVESKIARNIRPQIAALETLNALLRAWGVGVPAVQGPVATAYEKSLMFGEHTWGYNMWLLPPLYGKDWEAVRAQGTYDKLERSFVEKGQYIRDAQAAVDPALRANLEALARAIHVQGPRIVVFNPLAWPRVHTPVVVDTPAFRAEALRDVVSGEVLPVEREGSQLRFLAGPMPSQGYRTYVPVADDGPPSGMLEADSAGTSLENDALRVRLDPLRGGIASIVEKATGRELVDASKYAAGQYLYERFDHDVDEAYLAAYCKIRPDWAATFGKPKLPPAAQAKYCAASPKDMTVKVHHGAVSATVTMSAAATAEVPHAVTLKYTLYRGRVPYVDMQWAVSDKRPDPWPEAGWICLPLKAQAPQFRLGRVGSIIDPSGDIVPGANHDIFCLSGGMTVAGKDGRGAGLVPLDSPLVSLGYPGIYRYTKQWEPRSPVVFVNLFNNIWGTNFQRWIGGSWSSRVRLWPKTDAALMVEQSWAARSPCLAAAAEGAAGSLPATQGGVWPSSRAVLVTAFAPGEGGKPWLLRLWEQAGRDSACQVGLPAGLKATFAQPCDLRGRSVGRPIAIRDGSFVYPADKFAPASFLLQ